MGRCKGMLNIHFGSCEGEIYNPPVYFKNQYEDEWITDELSKEMILGKVWDIDGNFVGDNTVSVTINRLKKKLGKTAEGMEYIRNVFGMGYVFGE